MSYRDYLATTSRRPSDCLEAWKWLVPPQCRVRHLTLGGDAILLDGERILLLETDVGLLREIAASAAAFDEVASEPQNLRDWFKAPLVDRQVSLGMVPGQEQCLSFIHPPVLSGAYDADNFELCDLLVHFQLTGQIHEQIKDTPDGTPIQIKIAPTRSPATRPWWRFW